MSIKNGKLLYHLTSLANLESILIHGLLSRKHITQNFDDIADTEIIDFRQTSGLNSYIPFHFFAKNPFDGKVQRNHPTKIFIYITILRSFAESNNFYVIPKHPKSIIGQLLLLSYSDGINAIDWDKMETRDYSDQNCKNICMAEALSQNVIYPKDFNSIFVKTEVDKQFVIKICIKHYNLLPFHVNLNPNMFLE